MRKLKSKLVIEFEVEPHENFKKIVDEDGKRVYQSYCTKVAKACINAVEMNIVHYIEQNIVDEQDELAFEALDIAEVGTDFFDRDCGFKELVKSFKIRCESKRLKFSDIDLLDLS